MIRLALDCALFVLLALSSWLVADALAAPLPRPRPPRPAPVRPELPGLYEMTQGGTKYTAVFWLGGDYRAWRAWGGGTPGGAVWVGRWELEGDRLAITERCDPLGADHTFSWRLVPGKLETDGGNFKLRRLP